MKESIKDKAKKTAGRSRCDKCKFFWDYKCKDCKHWHTLHKEDEDAYGCCNLNGRGNYGSDPKCDEFEQK